MVVAQKQAQINETESPDIYPSICDQPTSLKRGRNIHQRKDGAGKTGQSRAKNETGSLSYTTHRNQLPVGYLNMRLETLKVLEENRQEAVTLALAMFLWN